MKTNKQPLKLVALDLDGTLLNGQKEIPPDTVRMLEEVKEAGVKVTLVTGRPLLSVLPYAKLLNLDIPLITCNGAVISTYPAGEYIEKNPLSMSLAKEMLKELEDAGFYVKVYVEDTFYVEQGTPATVEFSRLFGIPFQAVGRRQLRNLPQNPLKIVVIERSGRIKDVWRLLRPWQEHFTISRDGIYGIEITHKTATKGSALQKVCHLLHVPLHEVMAVGNEGNDVTMIECAGLGVAMGNAYEELKQAAQFVTKSNEEQGVSYVLKKFILDKTSE